MIIDEKNLVSAEKKVVNFMDTRDLVRARTLCTEILLNFKESDTAVFFDGYLSAQDKPENCEYFFEKYYLTFELLEKRNFDSVEKAVRMATYLEHTGLFLRKISNKDICNYYKTIFKFVNSYLDTVKSNETPVSRDFKVHLCKGLLQTMKFMTETVCKGESVSIEEKVECCYTYGNWKKDIDAFINNRENMTEQEFEEKMGAKVLEIQKEIDKIKPQFDETMEKGSFFKKHSAKIKVIRRRIYELVCEQRNYVFEYEQRMLIPYHWKLNELWQYFPDEVEKVKEPRDNEIREKVENFSRKYNVENYFFYYYRAKIQKQKDTDKKLYKKYDPTKKGLFYEEN